MAIGLMACRILQKMRRDLRGTVKFMFQPAEEGPGGAMPMIQEGILRDPRVDAAFALHLWNDLPAGTVGVRDGPMFAGADEFVATVKGRGGHASAPHATIDPIPAAASLIHALLEIPARKVDPIESSVLTVGRVDAGTRFNIIPDDANLYATVRYFKKPVQAAVRREVARAVKHVCAAHGAGSSLRYESLYPPTVNDPDMSDVVRRAAALAVGEKGVKDPKPAMGAEDMSFVLQRVPGCYFVLGSGPARGEATQHHSARFVVDEAALPAGVETWVRLALNPPAL